MFLLNFLHFEVQNLELRYFCLLDSLVDANGRFKGYVYSYQCSKPGALEPKTFRLVRGWDSSIRRDQFQVVKS